MKKTQYKAGHAGKFNRNTQDLRININVMDRPYVNLNSPVGAAGDSYRANDSTINAESKRES